jgi:protein-L-isoaspartate(D-aspartate) O-methyltransferase
VDYEKGFSGIGSEFVVMKILYDLNNFFFKSNINDLISDLKQNNFTNRTVLKYLEKIPREIFVKKKFANVCYNNVPFPIDCNQTTSQPLVIANMIDSLNIKKTDLVLEIGTGTGYQTALLSYLCKHVFTIEIFEKLINQAKNNHTMLNLKNISYLLGDGLNGWNKPILFDSIIISAASKKVPIKLLKTLKIKGKIIFPKEYFPKQQKLLLLKKLNELNYSSQELFDVSFVPLL